VPATNSIEGAPGVEESLEYGLRDLAGLGRAATSTAGLLTAALPRVQALTAARAVIALQVRGDDRAVVARSGEPLELPADLDLADVRRHETTAVDVPAAWAGVAAIAVRELAGGITIVLAWDRGQADATTELVLSIVDAEAARLAAEEELTDLVARVDNAQQLADMGDYDWHIASDTNRWSDQLYRIYGHEPQSFNPSYARFLALIHPDDRDRIQAIHQRAYATGDPFRMIERVVRPDGEVRYLESNGEVVHDESGRPVRMRGTCIDITDRVLAEQDRERSAARLLALVESAPDAIVLLDHEGLVVQANGRATNLLGGDPVGRMIGDVLPWPGPGSALALDATGLDGRALQLDVATAGLSDSDEEGLVACFLRDAGPRLVSESMAATVREAKVRRHQALELNDNVVQGLSAAALALQVGSPGLAGEHVDQTLSAARHMMNEWLQPLSGEELQPGDLVRSTSSGAATASDAVPEAAEASVEEAPRVLLVDDHADVRQLLRIQLETASRAFEIVGEAEDGEQAVEMATRLQPAVVLLDLAMPKMDGLQALPLIREAVPGIRVIVLSGFDRGTMAEKALAAGADAYLEKGLTMAVDETIVALLGSPAPGSGA
jgi:PAS domain S-box-containing protein